MTTAKPPLSMERIEDFYTWAIAWDAFPGPDREDLVRLAESNRAEFRAALAAHDAEMAQAPATVPNVALWAVRQSVMDHRALESNHGVPCKCGEDNLKDLAEWAAHVGIQVLIAAGVEVERG